ncbi:MAG: hypothetical protein J1E64_12095 [Acetatifactor sp.]|nr:hypothetical protein [Acetatifactor sp.]
MKSKCFSTRILFAMLSVLMALSFTSCGREEESVPEEIQYVYVPEFTDMSLGEYSSAGAQLQAFDSQGNIC